MKSESVKATLAILVVVLCLFGDAVNNHKFSNLFLSNLLTSPKQTKTFVIPIPRGEYGVMNVSYSPVEILKTSTGYVKFDSAEKPLSLARSVFLLARPRAA